MERCNHIGVKIWDAYLHDIINEQQTRAVNAHLLTCSTCNHTLNALETENAMIGLAMRSVPLQRMSVSAADLVVTYTEGVPVRAHARVDSVAAAEAPSWRNRIASIVSKVLANI